MNYDGFKEYLNSLGYADKTIKNNLSYIRRLLKILNNIDEYSQLNEYEKLYKFSNVQDSYKNIFDKFHDYNTANDSTFTNYRNSAKKYIKFSEDKEIEVKQTMQPLNQILYGPPGTGKTYNTINRALEIILEKEPNEELEKILKKEIYTKEERKTLKDAFEEYKKLGQIEFVTFHQSYGYEEFVEGIKADIESDDLRYSLEDGIFKKLSKKAQIDNIFKLGQIIGKYKVVGLSSELIKLQRENKSIIPIPMYLLNEVLELYKKKIITIENINTKNIIDKMSLEAEKFIINGYPNVFRDLIQHYENFQKLNEVNQQNYILIIDEINRGNISKIFGELITLIEPSKRIGEDEEIFLKLPNSNESFGVPSNLYIIGTMNTADRSIAQIDTALRRRFEFVEMMPQPNLLKDVIIEEIEMSKLLEAINEHIEYIYDREHTIGHSYFMPLIKEQTKAKLDEIFRVNIIPLLSEYFYSDWEDICEVLNDDKAYFIKEKELTYKPKKDRGNRVYSVNHNTFEVDGYINIYNGLEQ